MSSFNFYFFVVATVRLNNQLNGLKEDFPKFLGALSPFERVYPCKWGRLYPYKRGSIIPFTRVYTLNRGAQYIYIYIYIYIYVCIYGMQCLCQFLL